MSGSGPFPNLGNDIYNSDNYTSFSILYSDDPKRNNEALQKLYMKSKDKNKIQGFILQNEENQDDNEDNGNAPTINTNEFGQENFGIGRNNGSELTSGCLVLANGNNNRTLPFKDLYSQNNHSLTEQGSTFANTLISSQKFNSGTNEENKGSNKSENNFTINNENNSADSESNKEGKVEMEEEESQKFDLIKDSSSKHNSGNALSEEIKGKNKELNKDTISNKNQNVEIIIDCFDGNKDSFHKDFGDINKTNTLNKNGNMKDFEKDDSSFGMNIFPKKDNPIFACQKEKDKKNCSNISPNLGQEEPDEERIINPNTQTKKLSNINNINTKDNNTFNITQNNLINGLSGKSSNVNYAEIGNNINSNDISKKNDSLDNLLSKKRKREGKKIFEINKSEKYGTILEDKKKLNSDKNDKFFVIKNNNELKQEPKVAINSSAPPQTNSMKNDKSVKQIKNQNKIFKVLEYHLISKEIKSKEEIIKKKRDKIEGIFRSKLSLVKGKSERQLTLGDIERYNYRKFKNYLKKKKDEYDLNNYFWDAFFAPKKDGEPVLELTINKKNIKFPSHSHKLMAFLFSIDDCISDFYENLLKDVDFQNNYEVDKNSPNVYIYKFYGKNLHKIYCDKYEESDLDKDMEK